MSKISDTLAKVYSPQDKIKIESEKEKKMRREIYEEVENEFYSHANLARLFTEEMAQEGLLKYAPVIGAALSLVTLLAVIAT